MVVKLYVEGAAKSDFDRSRCRKAFAAFFRAAGFTKPPATNPCGPRNHAFDAFQTAVRIAANGELPLLLVDSEGPVQPGHSSWQHLKDRDKWDQPTGAGDDQAFLMVQAMETWFLCDKEMLKGFFDQNFRESHIKQWPIMEEVHKDKVLDVLKSATAGCKKKRYRKGGISFKMLEELDPQKVESACPHAKALFDRLRKLCH